MWKSIFLVGIFALFLFCCALIYAKIIQEDNIIQTENKTLSQFHDSSKKGEAITENDFNIKVLYFEEKYNSINKRFDDLYILGSMIILLLITINVGLFINTQNKVEKYFSDNFDVHEKRAKDSATKAGEAYGQLLTLIDNTKKMINQQDQTVVLPEPPPIEPSQP